MEENQFYTIILRHDESTKWMIYDPVLALGEYGVEDDTHRIKRGDGKTKWSDLLYEHFGLESLVTFENIQGEIEDNEKLKEAFDNKVSKDMFNKTNNTIVSALSFKSEEGAIGKLTKVTTNMFSGSTKESNLIIQSNDNSLEGIWYVDEKGVDILNLGAKTVVPEYKIQHRYFPNQLCFYKGRLLRAKREVITEEEIDFSCWDIISTKIAEELIYDSSKSELTVTNVQDAIDQLDQTKVTKTNKGNQVYVTDEDGNQTTMDIDDIGTVDSVNGILPDENDNVTITGEDIEFSKTDKTSVKDVVDTKATTVYVDASKVDKQIGDTLVVNTELLNEEKPTIKITKGDTETNEQTEIKYTIETKGDIKTALEDKSLIIDSTEIDNKINNNIDRLNEVDNTLTEHKKLLDEHTSDITSLTTDVNRLKNKRS